MLGVGCFSTKLLLKGKLLRNPEYFARETALETVIGFLPLVGANLLGLDLWLSVTVAGLLTGMLMP